jgi:putative DNA primase/helicase
MTQVKEINPYEPKRKNAPPPPPPGPDHGRDDWKTFLRTNKTGDFKGDVLNISLALKLAPEWSGLLGWDESWLGVVALLQPPFSTKKRPPFSWSEEHSTLLAAWLLHRGFASIGERTLERSVKAVAVGHPFHKVREYLNSLVWDRRPRIAT